MSKPPRQWSIPMSDGASATISIDEDLCPPAVLLTIPPGAIGGEARTLATLDACQLGMALQDASRVAGQLAARRKR